MVQTRHRAPDGADLRQRQLERVPGRVDQRPRRLDRAAQHVRQLDARAPQLEAEVQRSQEVEGEQQRQLELSRSRLQRAEALLKDGFGTQQAVDDARSEVIRIEGGIATASAARRSGQATRQQLDSEIEALYG